MLFKQSLKLSSYFLLKHMSYQQQPLHKQYLSLLNNHPKHQKLMLFILLIYQLLLLLIDNLSENLNIFVFYKFILKIVKLLEQLQLLHQLEQSQSVHLLRFIQKQIKRMKIINLFKPLGCLFIINSFNRVYLLVFQFLRDLVASLVMLVLVGYINPLFN